MLSDSFFGVTTIGAHHSVGCVTGMMMPCSCRVVSSARSLSRYAKGICLGVFTQKGLASLVRMM